MATAASYTYRVPFEGFFEGESGYDADGNLLTELQQIAVFNAYLDELQTALADVPVMVEAAPASHTATSLIGGPDEWDLDAELQVQETIRDAAEHVWVNGEFWQAAEQRTGQ